MSILLRGLLIGLLFGIPVGAVGAMTVQRTLSKGIGAGILTGVGSSAADCIYACVGAFGLTIISDFLTRYQTVINLVGGVFLVLMGIMIIVKRGQVKRLKEVDAGSKAKMFLTSFTVAITNPATVLTFLFAFSYFGLSEVMSAANGCLLVAGVFLGTMVWWVGLSLAAGAFKNKVNDKTMKILNIIFGSVLIVFALVIFIRAIVG